MSSEVKLVAQQRSEFGKGAARRLRRAHQIPAVMYGHGTEPVHITLPGHESMLALKSANVLLSIEIDGTTQLALAKDIQRDPIKPVIDHVDLVIVRRGEKVTVDIPIVVIGEAAVDTLVNLESNTIQVAVDATRIPTSIEVDVEGLNGGSQILAGAIVLPEGAVLAGDPDSLVVNVTAAVSAEAMEAELAEAEAEAGIEHDAPNEDTDAS